MKSVQRTMFLVHQILKDSRRVVWMTERQRDSMSEREQLMAAASSSRSEEPSISPGPNLNCQQLGRETSCSPSINQVLILGSFTLTSHRHK